MLSSFFYKGIWEQAYPAVVIYLFELSNIIINDK